MSSSRFSESVIYTEAELSEMERNRKLMGTISKRLDKKNRCREKSQLQQGRN
jgi:hypothetical protein